MPGAIAAGGHSTMCLFRNAVGQYWVIYYLVYVCGVGVGLWRHWDDLRGDEGIYLLAAIFGVAVGIALLAAIVVEVIGRMVLLIPAAWNKAKAEGRAEGRVEERKRLKKEYAARYQAAYERFGIEVDGVLVLPRTPEVERFLAGEAEEPS